MLEDGTQFDILRENLHGYKGAMHVFRPIMFFSNANDLNPTDSRNIW